MCRSETLAETRSSHDIYLSSFLLIPSLLSITGPQSVYVREGLNRGEEKLYFYSQKKRRAKRTTSQTRHAGLFSSALFACFLLQLRATLTIMASVRKKKETSKIEVG